MTATVTEATRALFAGSIYRVTSATFGGLVILMLLALLAQQEIARASASPRSRTWIAALNIATLPLLLAFAIIVLARFVILLFPNLR